MYGIQQSEPFPETSNRCNVNGSDRRVTAEEQAPEISKKIDQARKQAELDAAQVPGGNDQAKHLQDLRPVARTDLASFAKTRRQNARYLNQFFAHPWDRGKRSPFQEHYIAKMREAFTVGGKLDEAHLEARAISAERQFVAYLDHHADVDQKLLNPGEAREILSNTLSPEEKQKIARARVEQAAGRGGIRGRVKVGWTKFRCWVLFLSDLTPQERHATICARLDHEHHDLSQRFDAFIDTHTQQGRDITKLRYPHLTAVFDGREPNGCAKDASPVLYRRAFRSHMDMLRSQSHMDMSRSDADYLNFGNWVCGSSGGDSSDPSGTALAQLTKCDRALTDPGVTKKSFQNRRYLENRIAELDQLKDENAALIQQGEIIDVPTDEGTKIRDALLAELRDCNTAIDALRSQLQEFLNRDSISRNLSELNIRTAICVLENKIRELRNESYDQVLWDDVLCEKEVSTDTTFASGSSRIFTDVMHSPEKLRDADAVDSLILAIKTLRDGGGPGAGKHAKDVDIRDVKRFTKGTKKDMRRWVNDQLNQQVVRDGYRHWGKKRPQLSGQDWQAVEAEVRRKGYPKETVQRQLVVNGPGYQEQFSFETVPTGTPQRRRNGPEKRRAHAPNLLLHVVRGPKGQVLSRSVGVDNLDSVKLGTSDQTSDDDWQKWAEVLGLACEDHRQNAPGRDLPQQMVHVDVRLSKQGDHTSRVAEGLRGSHKFRSKDDPKAGPAAQRAQPKNQAKINVSPICFNFAVDDLGNAERERRNTQNMTELVGPLDTVGDLGGEIGKAIERCQAKLDGLQGNQDAKDKAEALQKQINLLEEQGKAVRQMFREGRHKTGRGQAYEMSTAVLSLVSTASKAELAAGNRGTAFTSSHGGSVEEASYLRCQLTAHTIHGAMGVSPHDSHGRAITLWALAQGDGNVVGIWQNGYPPSGRTNHIADRRSYDKRSLDRHY